MHAQASLTAGPAGGSSVVRGSGRFPARRSAPARPPETGRAGDPCPAPRFHLPRDHPSRAQRRSESAIPTRDMVPVEVAQTGNREAFAWPGKPFEASHLSQMVSGALTSNGDFALHARDLFVNDHALFGSAGAESLTGRETFRYDFELPTLWSGWNVSVGRASGVVGVRGSIWPSGSHCGSCGWNCTGWRFRRRCRSRRYPRRWSTARCGLRGRPRGCRRPPNPVVSLGGETDRNRMEFSHCRATEHIGAAVRAETGFTEAPPELNLRAGLAVPIRLTTAVDSRTAKVGDPVEAQVDADIRDHNEVVLPKGARITGRVRRLERYREPAPHFIVSLEFTTVEADSRRASFFRATAADGAAGVCFAPARRGGVAGRRHLPGGRPGVPASRRMADDVADRPRGTLTSQADGHRDIALLHLCVQAAHPRHTRVVRAPCGGLAARRRHRLVQFVDHLDELPVCWSLPLCGMPQPWPEVVPRSGHMIFCWWRN